jgi:polyhydroxyalkanoate synthesis regulator phasin
MTKNTLDRLASLGEEVIGKAAQNPATSRLLSSAMQLKDRVDDLTKRVRGLEAMEKRIDPLEKRVAKLESKPKATTKTSAAKKTDGV